MSALPRNTLVFALLGLAAVCWVALPSPTGTPPPELAAAPTPVSDYRVSGPFTHENLSVFLLHGPDSLPPRPVVTLDEAIGKSTFVVHETGTVNTLVVENNSDDDVLIQPGDIVRGGKQDRLIAAAVLVPAKSGQIAVPSFCVEQGRWSGRGKEAAGKFSGNDNSISGKDLKNAALVDGEQSKVWENVAKVQQQLAANVGRPVASAESPTSLELALSSTAVTDRLKGYESALGGVLRGSRSAVGYVIAVNGKVTGAEVYGSSAVLAKAWPKAVRSASVEALAEWKAGDCAAVTVDAVVAFLADAEKGQADKATEVAVGQVAAANFRNVAFNEAAPEPPVQRLADGNREVQDLLEAVQPLGQAGGQPAQPQPAPILNPVNRVQGQQLGRNQAGGAGAAPVQAAPVQVNRTRGQNAVMVESRAAAQPALVIHRSFIAK